MCKISHSFVISADLTFNDFCNICAKEPATSEDELMKAFKKIDLNGDGYLSNSELRKVLTTVSHLLFGISVVCTQESHIINLYPTTFKGCVILFHLWRLAGIEGRFSPQKNLVHAVCLKPMGYRKFIFGGDIGWGCR